MDVCQRCGKCCMEHVILLTFQDLHEIMEFFPTTILEQVITLYTVGKDYVDLAALHHAYNSFQILDASNTLQEYYLGLKFWPIPHGQSTCVFYNAFTHQCRVQVHKPLDCRMYPYTFCANQISLQFEGRCPLPVPSMDFTDTKARIDLIHDEELSREVFKSELANWGKNYQDGEKTLNHFMEFASSYIQQPKTLHLPCIKEFTNDLAKTEINQEQTKGMLQAHMDSFSKRGLFG
jgi:Fe-S-cluster containining protein